MTVSSDDANIPSIPVATTTTSDIFPANTDAILGSDTARKRKSSHNASTKKKRKKASRQTLSLLSFADEIDDSDLDFASSPSPGAENLGAASSSLSGATAARFKQEKNQRRRDKKRISSINDRTRMGLFSTVQSSLAHPASETTSAIPNKETLCLERVQIGVSETIGRRNYMEDRHTIITDFAQPASLRTLHSPNAIGPMGYSAFVAVYDGHGGASVAECAQVLACRSCRHVSLFARALKPHLIAHLRGTMLLPSKADSFHEHYLPINPPLMSLATPSRSYISNCRSKASSGAHSTAGADCVPASHPQSLAHSCGRASLPSPRHLPLHAYRPTCIASAPRRKPSKMPVAPQPC